MMKNSILLLLLVLTSCKGIEWAENSLSTIHRKFPELEERNCADRFPIISDTITISDTSIRWANNIDYSAIIDSLYAVAFNEIEPVQPNDTCTAKLLPYVNKISGLQQQIKALKSAYKPCDTSFMVINHRTVVTQESTAKTAVEKRRADAAVKSASSWRIAAIILGSLLILSIAFHIISPRRGNENS